MSTKSKSAKSSAKTKKAMSPKKRGIWIAVCILTVLALAGAGVATYFILSKNDGPEISTLRYEVVPSSSLVSGKADEFQKAGSNGRTNALIRQAAEKQEDDVVKYSSKDDEKNYYLFYMGYVKSTPVASNFAVGYDGRTPISVSFSRSTVTEDSVERSVETCVSETVRMSHSLSVSVTATLEYEGGAVFAKTKASLAVGLGYTFTKENETERSTTNTLTTAQSTAYGLEEAISYTIGEHGEAAGKYRLALFATVDVYIFAEFNTTNTKLISVDTLVSARPSTYHYMVDYDPTEDGEFRKTSVSDLMVLSDEFVAQLEFPTDRLEDNPVPDIEKAGEEYVPMTATAVEHDRGYDPSRLDTSVTPTYTSADGVRLLITPCIKNDNGSYTKFDGTRIYIEMLQDPTKWEMTPLGVSKGHTARVASDICDNVYDSSLRGTKVGQGANQVTAYYNNKTNEVATEYNFMENKGKGTTIEVLNTGSVIDTIKILTSVRILVVYQLREGDYWTDWRVEKTITFNW